MNNTGKKFLFHLPILIVIILAGYLYFTTCPRDLAWVHYSQDTGDLITAAHILDIPHPTGYPLFTLLGHLFTRLDLGIFWDHPVPWNNSPFKLTIFVILTSLLNLYILWLIQLKIQKGLNLSIAGKMTGSVAAASGGFIVAISYSYWSQSIIPEVYVLNLLFFNLTLLQVLNLGDEEGVDIRRWRWALLGATVGSGIIHHMSFLLFLPGFLILMIFCVPPINRGRLKQLVSGFILSLIPLLYMPIRSAQNPPLDTTNTEHLSNFFHHITAAAYRQYFHSRPVGEMLTHLNGFDLGEEFWQIGVVLICTGILGLYLKRNRFAGALLAVYLLSIFLVLIHATNYTVYDKRVFFLPAFFIMAHIIGVAISFLVDFIVRTSRQESGVLKSVVLIFTFLTIFIWALGLIEHAYDWNIDSSESQTAKEFGSKAFAELEEDALIFTVTDGKSFSMIYHRYVLFRGLREDVDIIFVPRIHTRWWWENVRDGNPDIKLSIEYTDDINAIIADIIRTNISDRPIYTSYPLIPLPDEYGVIKKGNIFRILPSEEIEQLKGFYHRMLNIGGEREYPGPNG